MGSSTFTDRFNYKGYAQIVKYFRTDDHMSWNLQMCPVPIKLVRVKTDVSHTTFLEHDAIAQLQEYRTWKETKYGKQNSIKTAVHDKAEHSNPFDVAAEKFFGDRYTCRNSEKSIA